MIAVVPQTRSVWGWPVARRLFRERALAGQATTEAIDEPVRLVTVPTWAALGVAVFILVAGVVWLVGGSVAVTTAGPGVIVNEPTNARILAPADGTVTQAAELGAVVRKGQAVVAVTTRDDGTAGRIAVVTAPFNGTVVGIGPGVGAGVVTGEYTLTLAPTSKLQLGYLYVPAREGELVRTGMTVRLAPESVDTSVTGLLLGQVATVSPLPVPVERIAYVVGDRSTAERIASEGDVVELTVLLQPDPSTPTQLAWTQPPGPTESLTSGVPTSGTVVLAEVAPYRAFLGSTS